MSTNSLPIATWDLRPTNDQPPSAEESIVLTAYTPGSGEAVFDDKRKVVQPADTKPGGKYRCKPSISLYTRTRFNIHTPLIIPKS